MRNLTSRGFSLLELLVVLIIISLMTAAMFFSVSIGERSGVKATAHRLRNLIELAQEDAQSQDRNLAIGFWKHGWAFYALDRSRSWQPFSEGRQLRPGHAQKDITLNLQLQGQNVVLPLSDQTRPQVFFLSSGGVQPFVLKVREGSGPTERLRGNSIGQVSMETLHANQ